MKTRALTKISYILFGRMPRHEILGLRVTTILCRIKLLCYIGNGWFFFLLQHPVVRRAECFCCLAGAMAWDMIV